MPEAASPTENLSVDQLRSRLEARTRDIHRHIDGLRHELTTFSDVTVGGIPPLDHVRTKPARSLLVTGGVGFVVGAALGLSAWWEERQKAQQAGRTRLLLASVLGGASERLSRGGRPEEALRSLAKKGGPLVYLGVPPSPEKGTIRETLDLAVKTALGFGVKTGMDLLTKKLTGKPEVFQAAKGATERPPPPRPYG